MISTSNSQSQSVEIRATDAAGVAQPIAHMNGAIRPGQSVSFTLDIFNAQLVTENAEAVACQVRTFMENLQERAIAQGFPMG